MRRKSEKHGRSASRGSSSQNEPKERGKDFWIKNTKTFEDEFMEGPTDGRNSCDKGLLNLIL